MSRPRVCGVGDNTVDRYLHTGMMYPGGNAVNVAVYARREGAETGYLGVVGDDSGGDLLLGSLLAEGVDTSRVRREAGPTSWTEVRIVAGDRSFGEHLAGVSQFRLHSDDLDYLASFDIVHLGDSSGLEAQLPALAARCRISYDFSDRTPDYIEHLLPFVDIATFSVPADHAATHAGGGTADRVAGLVAWARKRGPRYVAVTMGAAGAVVSDGDALSHAAATEGVVQDTLGAGDAFIGRYLLAVLSGEPPAVAVTAAVRAAARACSVDGAFGNGVADTLGPRPAGTDLSARLGGEGGTS